MATIANAQQIMHTLSHTPSKSCTQSAPKLCFCVQIFPLCFFHLSTIFPSFPFCMISHLQPTNSLAINLSLTSLLLPTSLHHRFTLARLHAQALHLSHSFLVLFTEVRSPTDSISVSLPSALCLHNAWRDRDSSFLIHPSSPCDVLFLPAPSSVSPPNTSLSLHYHLLRVSDVICTGSLIQLSSCLRGAELSNHIMKNTYVVTHLANSSHNHSPCFMDEHLITWHHPKTVSCMWTEFSFLFFDIKNWNLFYFLPPPPFCFNAQNVNMFWADYTGYYRTNDRVTETSWCNNCGSLGEGHVIWLSLSLQIIV